MEKKQPVKVDPKVIKKQKQEKEKLLQDKKIVRK